MLALSWDAMVWNTVLPSISREQICSISVLDFPFSRSVTQAVSSDVAMSCCRFSATCRISPILSVERKLELVSSCCCWTVVSTINVCITSQFCYPRAQCICTGFRIACNEQQWCASEIAVKATAKLNRGLKVRTLRFVQGSQLKSYPNTSDFFLFFSRDKKLLKKSFPPTRLTFCRLYFEAFLVDCRLLKRSLSELYRSLLYAWTKTNRHVYVIRLWNVFPNNNWAKRSVTSLFMGCGIALFVFPHNKQLRITVCQKNPWHFVLQLAAFSSMDLLVFELLLFECFIFTCIDVFSCRNIDHME